MEHVYKEESNNEGGGGQGGWVLLLGPSMSNQFINPPQISQKKCYGCCCSKWREREQREDERVGKCLCFDVMRDFLRRVWKELLQVSDVEIKRT